MSVCVSVCLSVCLSVCVSQEFASSVHTCEVCFTDKPGSKCLCLDECRHVFCCECLRANCELNITEGSVTNLKCMMTDCTSQLHPAQVSVFYIFISCSCHIHSVGLYQIPALAYPEYSHFLEIRRSPAPAIFLAGFGRRQCSCTSFT